MNLFFDTEFTGLHQNTTLISLAIVSEDKRIFYAEFTDYDRSQVDNWLKDNVIANLKFNDQEGSKPYNISRHYSNPIGQNIYNGYNLEFQGNKQEVLRELKRWLKQFGNEPIQFVSDVSHFDFVLLCELFGGALKLPDNINPFCYDVNQTLGDLFCGDYRFAFDSNREDILGITNKTRKHNALHDAHIIRKLYAKLVRTAALHNKKPTINKERG